MSFMTSKKVGCNTGQSGRINVSESEMDKLGVEFGDAIDVEVVDSKEVARTPTINKDTAEFLIVTPT